MAEALRISEITKDRTRVSKSFALDNGKISTDFCNGSVHYLDIAGDYQDIVLSFADKTTQFLAEEHYMTNGYSKSLDYNKMWGLRYRTADDLNGDNCQYEMTPEAVMIDGGERLSGTKFTGLNIEGNKVTHNIDAVTSYVHELRWDGVVGYVKVDKITTDFTLREKIHLKGFHCTNVLKDGEYELDIRGGFNFVRDTEEFIFAIKRPMMWDEKTLGDIEQVSIDIQHRLYFDGLDLIYEKTPTAKGKAWLTSSVGAVSIDTSTDFSGSTSDASVSSGNKTVWATARNVATGASVTDTTVLQVRAIFSSPNYAVSRLHFFFDTSSIGSDTIDSVDLWLRTQTLAGTTSIMAQLSTSADPVTTADIDSVSPDLDTGTYGFAAVPAAGNDFSITFNATGEGDINGAGITKICVRDNTEDYADVAPTAVNTSQFYAQDHATAAWRPKLTVVHTAAAGGRIMSSLTNHGGLAGAGGLAGKGGGLAA